MLVAKNISKSFADIKAVNAVNFCLNDRGITALLGPNGAGKTTLLRLLGGYYSPDEGEVIINNHNLETERLQALQDFAYVPENGALYEDMTVVEYCAYMANLHHLDSADLKANLASLSQDLGLQDVLGQRCDTLSKGYKRRVALAGALIHRPQTLLLDEPTEGLDPNQKYIIRDFLRAYGQRHTILVSTHIMEEVEAFADRVLMLNHGKLICDTTPGSLKSLTADNNIETAFRSITFENK